jgi:uncharacterized cupredoxin-like copper-binding protein
MSEWLPVRIEYAPKPDKGKQNVIDTVLLKSGQSIEWIWSHTKDGSFVSGYVINETKTR